MTDTSSLRAFIEARLAEDEARIDALAEGEPYPDAIYYGDMDDGARVAVEVNGAKRFRRVWLDSGHVDWGWTVHQEMREVFRADDVDRWRREVAAKRAILQAAAEYSPELEHGDNGEWALDFTLRALASVHADHPDYRTEWSTT